MLQDHGRLIQLLGIPWREFLYSAYVYQPRHPVISQLGNPGREQVAMCQKTASPKWTLACTERCDTTSVLPSHTCLLRFFAA